MLNTLTTPAVLLLTLAGSSQSFAYDLACLNGNNGFVLNGIDANDRSGFSVAGAGDVNGDGTDDFIIGAAFADPHGSNSGESYVVFGSKNVGIGGSMDLATLDGTNGFVLNGISANDQAGWSVSGAGDLNGDGIDDLVIGAYRASPSGIESGESYVVFGGVGIGIGGAIELSSLDGTIGFVLNGIDTEDNSGISVSGIGDINNDGIDDLIIGAYCADPNGTDSGESYVIFGGVGIGSSGSLELSSLDGTNGFVLNGIDTNDSSGRSVSGVGDVNGDGVDDLIIGADRADSYNTRNGESYIVFGGPGVGTGGSIELSSLDGTNGFVLKGIDAFDQSGFSVSGAGDVNGDGVDDLIIGAVLADPNGFASGETYVIFGGIGIGADGSIELSSLDGTNGFVINGANINDQSGVSVSGAGDVNGDSFDDVIVGAHTNSSSDSESGASYVVFGGVGVGAGGSLELSSLNAMSGFVLHGIDAGDRSGRSVAGCGDVNGDGVADLIIGAWMAGSNDSSTGESYVVFGSTIGFTIGFTTPADLNSNCSVNSVDLAILLAAWGTPGADLNADGTTDSSDLAILLAAWTG